MPDISRLLFFPPQWSNCFVRALFRTAIVQRFLAALRASDGELSQYSRFIMMMMLNHRERMLNEGLAMVALDFESMLTNSLAISWLSVRIDLDWLQ